MTELTELEQEMMLAYVSLQICDEYASTVVLSFPTLLEECDQASFHDWCGEEEKSAPENFLKVQVSVGAEAYTTYYDLDKEENIESALGALEEDIQGLKEIVDILKKYKDKK